MVPGAVAGLKFGDDCAGFNCMLDERCREPALGRGGGAGEALRPDGAPLTASTDGRPTTRYLSVVAAEVVVAVVAVEAVGAAVPPNTLERLTDEGASVTNVCDLVSLGLESAAVVGTELPGTPRPTPAPAVLGRALLMDCEKPSANWRDGGRVPGAAMARSRSRCSR
jgi:hypothetical protein